MLGKTAEEPSLKNGASWEKAVCVHASANGHSLYACKDMALSRLAKAFENGGPAEVDAQLYWALASGAMPEEIGAILLMAASLGSRRLAEHGARTFRGYGVRAQKERVEGSGFSWESRRAAHN